MIDSHAHLNIPPINKIVDDVIARAKSAGVRAIINVGSGDERGNEESLSLARRYEGFVFPAVGIHPHDAASLKAGWEKKLKAAASEGAVAIGETGLDYFRNHSPKDAQKAVFRTQLELACTLNLPVILHIRDAADDALAIIREVGIPGRGGVWHCFSGGPKDVEAAVKLRLFVSFAGQITYPNASGVRDAASACPMQSLLAETDCPYLAPQKYRGKTNEPAYLVETIEKIAELKGLSADETAEITAQNAMRLFEINP